MTDSSSFTLSSSSLRETEEQLAPSEGECPQSSPSAGQTSRPRGRRLPARKDGETRRASRIRAPTDVCLLRQKSRGRRSARVLLWKTETEKNRTLSRPRLRLVSKITGIEATFCCFCTPSISTGECVIGVSGKDEGRTLPPRHFVCTNPFIFKVNVLPIPEEALLRIHDF